MSHKQFPIDQKNVRFDTTESLVESIQKRPLVSIIIVRVRLLEWHDPGSLIVSIPAARAECDDQRNDRGFQEEVGFRKTSFGCKLYHLGKSISVK